MQKQLSDSDLQQWKSFDSFAFAMVKAIEGRERWVSKNPNILKTLKKEDGSKLFGSFIEKYPAISANDLFNDDPAAEQNCRGRVALICGYWRDVQGHGDLVDSHLSPLGFIPGIQIGLRRGLPGRLGRPCQTVGAGPHVDELLHFA
jgi:hypothetical protein